MNYKKLFFKPLQWKRIPSGGLQWSQNLTTNFRDSPLNLESKKQAISVVLLSFLIKILGKSIKGFLSYDRKNKKQTPKQRLQLYIQVTLQWAIHWKNLSNVYPILRRSQICKNKWIAMYLREQFKRAPYNYLIKRLNICNIQLSESEEYDIWWILSMYGLFRV